MDETFGQRIHRLRVARGLRVPDLAHASGLTECAVRHLESGQTNGASLIVGLHMSRYLNVSPDYLATGIDVNAEASTEMTAVLSRLDDYGRRIAALERRGAGGCSTDGEHG